MIGSTLLDIRTAVKQWSQRKQIPDATIDDFINITIQRASRSLRIPPMEKEVTPTVDANGYFAIPADFIEAKEVVAVRSNQTYVLDRKAIHEVDRVFDTSPGRPLIFGRSLGNFRVAPYDSPDPDETIYLYYYAMFGTLQDDTDCNWLSSAAGEVLLYGALAELAAYTRDEESEARWKAKFGEEIGRLQAVEDRAAWEGSTLNVTPGGSTPLRVRNLF